MARSRNVRLTALTLANALLPLAVLVFASGFFPFKPLLPGLATYEDDEETEIWGGRQPEAVFDRVVFMVVDALRSDFVYGRNSGFGFTQSLIRDGAAIPFTAHATPPTVTMPRVKALTTGSVPSFADLIFNLDESGSGSTLAAQDTWLAQLKAKGGKLVFYGDDTWLRLFPSPADAPGFFHRSDGTSSFFVSDFIEVDLNVTRHVPAELANGDWDAMLLHYLGLDHIGHKTGPNGPSMLPKQKEMDGIVRTIYEAMEREEQHANTLLVLAGDHGMNAGGNHGGSGPGETEPALMFASPKLKRRAWGQAYECPTVPKEGTEFHYYRKVEQSDLVPTLAGLMGFPVPKNSLGVFIEEFGGLWGSWKEGVQLVHQGGRQVKRIVEAAYGEASFRARVEKWKKCWSAGEASDCGNSGETEDELASGWARAEQALHRAHSRGDEDSWRTAYELGLSFSTAAQEALSTVASSYDIPRMLIGICLTASALPLASLSVPSFWHPSTASLFLALTTLLYAIMMFASSYVEEEQYFWYWLTPAWTFLLTANSAARTKDVRHKVRLAGAGALILAVHRMSIRWNQTGQKHAGEPDVVHSLFPQQFILMWVLVLAAYGYTCVMLARRTFLGFFSSEIGVFVAIIMVLPAVVFKLNFTQADAPELVRGLAYMIRAWTRRYSLVLQAQATFALLGVATLMVVAMAVGFARHTVLSQPGGPAVRTTLAERLHHLLTLFLITQTRAPNIPLFLGLEIQRRALSVLLASHKVALAPKRNASVATTELATTVLLLSHTYFFCMGGSNSISSVDLSNAYNGVAEYNIVAVGVLLLASNWTGPVWWCSAAVTLTFSKLAKSESVEQPQENGSRRWIDEERSKLHQDARGETKEKAAGQRETEHWFIYVASMTAFVAASLLAVMAACTALRTHLFIWTVFSPKYLYAMAWCVGWHLLVSVGMGSLLRWLGCIA